MKTIAIGQFKSDLSHILKEVQEKGEHYVLEYGKKHQKIAILVPYDKSYENKVKREFGIFQDKGSFKLHDEFEMTDEEFLDS